MAGEPLYPDALVDGPARGRAAALNPANRFENIQLAILGDHLDQQANQAAASIGNTTIPTQIIADQTRSVINPIDPATSPDIGFSWTINPYRGCEHGCIYCYARPTHEALGFSCGLDFETKIIAKHDAPRLLRKELAAPKWTGEPIMLSGVTDPYQPIEAKLKITRGCLQVLAECRQAVNVITKNRLILRDLDLLTELARHDAVRVAISVTSLDPKLVAKMEPRTSSPADRLYTISKLADAGIPVIVMTAPIIPAINDWQIPAILKAAGEAGATSAGYVMLRLPHQVKALFIDWLRRHFPDRAQHVESLIRQMHGGKLYDPTPGTRMCGRGPFAAHIQRLFRTFKKRYGLSGKSRPINTTAFRRPQQRDQMALWQ